MPEVRQAVETLMETWRSTDSPHPDASTYRCSISGSGGLLENEPEALLKDKIKRFLGNMGYGLPQKQLGGSTTPTVHPVHSIRHQHSAGSAGNTEEYRLSRC